MSLNKFITEVRKHGLATQAKFRVEFTFPESLMSSLDNRVFLKRIGMYCKYTQFPKIQYNTSPIKTYGPPRQYAFERSSNESVPITFYVDGKMELKKLFDRWAKKIQDTRHFHMSYYDDYVSDIRIIQVDKEDNDVYSIIIRDAFPKVVYDLSGDASGGNSPHELTVDFAYWYWTEEDAISKVAGDDINTLKSDQNQYTTTAPSLQHNPNQNAGLSNATPDPNSIVTVYDSTNFK